MIFQPPELREDEQEVLALLAQHSDDVRDRVGRAVGRRRQLELVRGMLRQLHAVDEPTGLRRTDSSPTSAR